MRPYLRPTAPIAPDALLPGDPKRAMELATALMARPLMSNLSRGLWGYSGRTHAGRRLTVQSTGIGGPSAAVVLSELAGHGVRRAIRVGTCVALDPGLRPGDTLVVSDALSGDGVGAQLADGSPSIAPDPELSARLGAAVERAREGRVASTDLYYEPDSPRRREWRDAGALAVELNAAALLAVGRRAEVAVACALVVAEDAAGRRLEDAQLDRAARDLGELASGALATPAQSSPVAASPP
jgi:uridine phosphorylase